MGISKAAFKAIRTLPELSKSTLKTCTVSPEPAVRRVLGQADGMLKNTGLRLQGELPVDQFMTYVPKAQRKAVASLLGDPETVQVAAKHNPNGRFSILGFLAKRGDKTVGKGALSVTDFGTPNAVAKWRATTGVNGKNLQINGFADCAGTATPQDVSLNPIIGRMLGLETQVGTIARQTVKADAAKLGRIFPTLESGDIVNAARQTGDQARIDRLLDGICKAIG